MIEVSALHKRYGDFTAVHSVSFSAQKGEVVGFLGPNGAGKTTTLRMLVTYLPPTSGKALIAGYDIERQSEEVRRRVGYLPETPPLYGEMTVAEYLTFVARIKGVPSREISARVGDVLDRCFIGDVRHKLCSHLSRGYRQRVGIAQAIVHRPDVIVLDEPTSGLDPKQIVEIRKLIHSLGAEHTVILSTHILPEVSMVCSKVVVIDRGRTVLEGPIAEVAKDRPLEEVFMSLVTRDTASTEAA